MTIDYDKTEFGDAIVTCTLRVAMMGAVDNRNALRLANGTRIFFIRDSRCCGHYYAGQAIWMRTIEGSDTDRVVWAMKKLRFGYAPDDLPSREAPLVPWKQALSDALLARFPEIAK